MKYLKYLILVLLLGVIYYSVKQFYIYRYENNLNTIRKEKGITPTINLDKKYDDYIKSRIYFLPSENINGFVGKTIKVEYNFLRIPRIVYESDVYASKSDSTRVKFIYRWDDNYFEINLKDTTVLYYYRYNSLQVREEILYSKADSIINSWNFGNS